MEGLSFPEINFAFVYRLTSLLGPDEILQHMSAPAPDWKQPAKYLSAACKSPLDALLNLTDHMGKVNCNDMKVYSSVALQTASSYGLSLEKRDQLAAVVLKMILVAKFNIKNITHLTMDVSNGRGVSMHTRVIGAGLYLASSLINHSCIANMAAVYCGSTVVFTAMKPIKAGEQLTMEYIAHLIDPVSRRQNICNSVHRFTCTCVACKEG
jgi:SET domain